MQKTAHYYFGKAEALLKLGFSQEAVSNLLVQDGMDKVAADEMTKEAWSFLGSLAGKIAPKLTQFAGAASKWGGGAAGTGFKGFVGNLASKAAGGLGKGMQTFSAAPKATTTGFFKNMFGGFFGSPNATGAGAKAGKAIDMAHQGSTLYNNVTGGGQQPQYYNY